jgi:hypothetical protein
MRTNRLSRLLIHALRPVWVYNYTHVAYLCGAAIISWPTTIALKKPFFFTLDSFFITLLKSSSDFPHVRLSYWDQPLEYHSRLSGLRYVRNFITAVSQGRWNETTLLFSVSFRPRVYFIRTCYCRWYIIKGLTFCPRVKIFYLN